MVINIEGNYGRLFQKVFMVLIPLKYNSDQRVQPDKAYSCEVEGIGPIGSVKCINVANNVLGGLSEQLMLITENNSHWRKPLYEKGCNQRTEVQTCTFVFLNRNNTAFNELIKRVAHDIKIELNPVQGQLL